LLNFDLPLSFHCLKIKKPDCHNEGNPAVFFKTRSFPPHSHEWFSFFLLYQVITWMTLATIKQLKNINTLPDAPKWIWLVKNVL